MAKCTNKKINLPVCQKRVVEVQFVDKKITSDGGVLLLREIDRTLKLTARLAKIIPEYRNKDRIIHSLESMLRQRIYSLALGYEDLNDQNMLRNDPALQTAVDRVEALASSPTLCRLENTANRQVAVAINELQVNLFIESFKQPPNEIILDFDATENEIHGNQEKRHYHGYYRCYCFLPLHVFCGEQLLVSYLRPSNKDGAKHAWAILALLVKKLRLFWPKTKIIFRGDSGFCRDLMLRWSEKNNVTYIVGIAQNKRLNEASLPLRVKAENQYNESQEKQKLFDEIQYAAKSWMSKRRVIVKAEHNSKGANPRYIISNDKDSTPQKLYEIDYCGRGNAENCIKEIKLNLFSNRNSCHKWWANQLRLLFSSLAYILIESTRRLALRNTELATAQCSTIRLKLYKIGAIILRNTRRIKFLFSSYYPYQKLFFLAANRLCSV